MNRIHSTQYTVSLEVCMCPVSVCISLCPTVYFYSWLLQIPSFNYTSRGFLATLKSRACALRQRERQALSRIWAGILVGTRSGLARHLRGTTATFCATCLPRCGDPKAKTVETTEAGLYAVFAYRMVQLDSHSTGGKYAVGISNCAAADTRRPAEWLA